MDSSEQRAHIINNFENIFYEVPHRSRKFTRWSAVRRGAVRVSIRDLEEAIAGSPEDLDVHQRLALALLRADQRSGVPWRVRRHAATKELFRPALRDGTADAGRGDVHPFPDGTAHPVEFVSANGVVTAPAQQASSCSLDTDLPATGAEGGECDMAWTEPERPGAERRSELAKYFTEPPDPRMLTTAHLMMGTGGVVATGAAALFATATPFVGGIALWCAAAVTVLGFAGRAEYVRRRDAAHPRPSDGDVDRMFAAELHHICGIALSRLGLSLDDLVLTGGTWDPVARLTGWDDGALPGPRRPLLVFGPHGSATMAMGRDAVWRFSAYRVMVICPTAQDLALYTCVLDLVGGTTSHEETHEYRYDDVVTVSTVALPGGDGEAGGPWFARPLLRELRIVISGGDHRGIVVGASAPGGPGAAVQSSGVDEIIEALRRVLRSRTGEWDLRTP